MTDKTETTASVPGTPADELRVQAAILRTPEFMESFDPVKFSAQLDRIATRLAQQPSESVGVEIRARELWAEWHKRKGCGQQVIDDCLSGAIQMPAVALDLLRMALDQQPTAGEDIMVNAAHDVYTLPLQPSGLTRGPRFVVHVPGPDQQPARGGEIGTVARRDSGKEALAHVIEFDPSFEESLYRYPAGTVVKLYAHPAADVALANVREAAAALAQPRTEQPAAEPECKKCGDTKQEFNWNGDGPFTCRHCYTPPSEPAAEGPGEVVDLHDLTTHREAWRNALLYAQRRANGTDDESYWQHEVKAFDKAFTAFDRMSLVSDYAGTPPRADAEVDGCHKLDTPERVRFYEQDFYVLSNFSALTLQWDGLRFDTSEAAYHYEKFKHRLPALCEAIRTAPSAHEAFKIAERSKHHRRPDWDEVKLEVMRRILRAKAEQHEYVRRKLLATGDRELVEDSWRDDFWGWGPNRGGQNWLGRLWMEVRAEMRTALTAAINQDRK